MKIDKAQFTFFLKKRKKEKIRIYLETANGTLELVMNEVNRTHSNGRTVLRGKSFDEK